MERLDKILSSQEICSRKEVKSFIKNRRIRINGEFVLKSDMKVDPENDIIEIDGELLDYRRFVYIMMNKPKGVLSASNDKNAATVIDLLPQEIAQTDFLCGVQQGGVPHGIFCGHANECRTLAIGEWFLACSDLFLEVVNQPCIIAGGASALDWRVECEVFWEESKQLTDELIVHGADTWHCAGVSQPGLVAIVEFVEHVHPVFIARLDFVQLVFHLRSETDIEELGELGDEVVVGFKSDRRGDQCPFLLFHIATLLDGVDNVCVGRGAAHTIGFKCLDQRGFGVAGRWLGEALFLFEFQQRA